jgi:hypothetical protein
MLHPNTYIQYNNLRIRNMLILVFFFCFFLSCVIILNDTRFFSKSSAQSSELPIFEPQTLRRQPDDLIAVQSVFRLNTTRPHTPPHTPLTRPLNAESSFGTTILPHGHVIPRRPRPMGQGHLGAFLPWQQAVQDQTPDYHTHERPLLL